MVQFTVIKKLGTRIFISALISLSFGEALAGGPYPPAVYLKRLHRFHNKIQKASIAEVDRRLFRHFCPEEQRHLKLQSEAYFQTKPGASILDLLAFETVNMYELRKSCKSGDELKIMSKGLRKRLTVLKLRMIKAVSDFFFDPNFEKIPNSLKNIIAIRYWEEEIKETFNPDFIINNADIQADFTDPSAYRYLTVSTDLDPHIEPFLPLLNR